MKIQGKQYQTIWLKKGDLKTVEIIDQRKLPFIFETMELKTVADVYFAIFYGVNATTRQSNRINCN